MSEEEKTQRCLQLIVLRLFDLEMRLLETQIPLFSAHEREQLKAAHKDVMDEDGEEALRQLFRGLRRQAGAVMDERSNDLSSASTDELWSALRHADRQVADAEFLDREWKQFWDAL
jgi:hypothetical protein